MDLAHVHEALLATHEHLLQNPADEVEGLQGASCPPHVKHLAQIAMESAGEGRSVQQWRSRIVGGLVRDRPAGGRGGELHAQRRSLALAVTGERDRQVIGQLDRVAVSDGQRCTTV